MTKSELIEVVSAEAKLTKGRAELVINEIFQSMVDALQRSEGIEIRGFGSFTVRQYKAYEGRNPRTGDPVHVPPKRLPFFKVGKDLRQRVNGEKRGDTPSPGREPSKAATSQRAATPKQPAHADPGITEDVI
ncbi:MAG: integration host factor subunit beta [Nannocystaceae bacterium]|nr:integration host factor subunit beta [Nannocystaceae bacterium]